MRALDISLATGAHGLPLMGTGDWNDGMNLVGAGGKGESVWLGWFLASLLRPFADLADARGDAGARRRISAPRRGARPRPSKHAWDGDWYRRAYFDDGTPLGSKENTECRIDAIAQSWVGHLRRAAIRRGRAGDGRRSTTHLVRRDDRLVLLLTPPFDHMTPSPGYIQGYVPGVRENGGQYTHAALWTVLAFARLGDGDRAAELFSLLNPLNHSRDRRTRSGAIASSPTSSPPTSTRSRRTPAAAAGRGTRARPAGCIASASNRCSASALAARRLHIDPCIPKDWPRYEVTVQARVERPIASSSRTRTVSVEE